MTGGLARRQNAIVPDESLTDHIYVKTSFFGSVFVIAGVTLMVTYRCLFPNRSSHRRPSTAEPEVAAGANAAADAAADAEAAAPAGDGGDDGGHRRPSVAEPEIAAAIGDGGGDIGNDEEQLALLSSPPKSIRQAFVRPTPKISPETGAIVKHSRSASMCLSTFTPLTFSSWTPAPHPLSDNEK